jgi:hypothetical protein
MKSPEAGHRTLGFHMTGDGTISAHKKGMIKKSVLFGEAIMGSSLWRSESAIAYNSFYLPSLGYGMCKTRLSLQECEDIQRPVINTILQKMGIHRKAARAVVFGTAKFGGLGLEHLAILQGHIRPQYLLGHLWCGDHTGQLMRMLIEYTQLEFGTMENILEQDYDKCSKCIINKNWITEIWQHLHSCKATFTVQQNWKPHSGRIHDTSIIITRGITGYTISDITNIQGTLIEPWALSRKRPARRMSAWAWPVHQRPKNLKAWKDALEFLAPERSVTPALGAWIKEHHQTQEW